MRRIASLLAVAALAVVPAAAQSTGPQVTFTELTPQQSGITWVHDNAMSEDRYLPETCGAGCAIFDYDNDGWMDIYFVNSGASDFFTPKRPMADALYRNNHDGTFTDVAEKAGIKSGRFFGMGASAGDFDGDGWQDLFVTAYGRNTLYRNNGNGTFTDVTEKAGLTAPGWYTCSVWFDYDRDGKLDLFVSSFVEYSRALNVLCGDNKIKRRFYCIPRLFKPTASKLYHNLGNGAFADVSKESGITSTLGKAFGAVATDINNDGWQDLFVACDTVANMLFLNKGDGTFEEIGLPAGVAYSDAGNPRSGMGVDAGDYDQDGWQDLFVANIDQELFSLYHNEKDETFIDKPGEIASATRMMSGWGLKFFDYDCDGDLDLFLANGHPDDMVETRIARVKYRQPMLMFVNDGKVYHEVSDASGPAFKRDYTARGAAFGDLDNDGDIDIVVSNNGAAPLVLRNDGGNRNNWVGLQLVATKSNPDAVGAIVTWEAGGKKLSRFKTAGGSYLASHDPREMLGLGSAAKVDSVEIRWPSGTIDKLTSLPTNGYVRVVEGKGLDGATAAAGGAKR